MVTASVVTVVGQHGGLVVVHQCDGGGVLLPRLTVHLHRRVAAMQLDLQQTTHNMNCDVNM